MSQIIQSTNRKTNILYRRHLLNIQPQEYLRQQFKSKLYTKIFTNFNQIYQGESWKTRFNDFYVKISKQDVLCVKKEMIVNPWKLSLETQFIPPLSKLWYKLRKMAEIKH